MDKKRRRAPQALANKDKENTSFLNTTNSQKSIPTEPTTTAATEVKASEEVPYVGTTDPEVLAIYKHFPTLYDTYRLLDKIGEGTFSTVYKAIDIRHAYYDNEDWVYCTNAPVLFHPVEKVPDQSLPDKLFEKEKDDNDQDGDGNDKDGRKRVFGLEKWRYVAVKRVYATSSPARIASEINMLTACG